MKKNLLAISLLTMGCLYGMLAAVVILIFLLMDLPITYGILFSLVILIIQFLVAPYLNDFTFKVFYKVDFNYKIPQYLEDFIWEVCQKYNMKYPKIGFINDGSPNAFTYGRTKNDARVVFTKGIFDLLTEEEVKSVVAHELGHAKHYDMLFMTVAQIVPLILYYIYEILLERNKRNSNNNDNDYSAMIGLIAYILYIISQYVILWLSRAREYYADTFAIEETKNPSALATALIKIGFGLAIGNKEEKSKTSNGNALGISNAKFSKGMAIASYNNGGVSKQNVINAMKWEKWNVWAKWHELHSTHPLISKRLLAISEQCEQFGQEPYIVFDEERPESYLDDFASEILISIAPFVVFLLTLFASIIVEIALGEKGIMIAGIGGILFVLSLFAQLNYTHKDNEYEQTNVADLLSEIKVSHITSIPCALEGTIIGRGNPGCVFNEDFVLKDETGIIFLDYNQPLHIIEKIFAIFKTKDYFDKKVIIKGWYRRSVVPYVEVRSIEIDGQVKKCHTYTATKVIYCILLAIAIGTVILSL